MCSDVLSLLFLFVGVWVQLVAYKYIFIYLRPYFDPKLSLLKYFQCFYPNSFRVVGPCLLITYFSINRRLSSHLHSSLITLFESLLMVPVGRPLIYIMLLPDPWVILISRESMALGMFPWTYLASTFIVIHILSKNFVHYIALIRLHNVPIQRQFFELFYIFTLNTFNVHIVLTCAVWFQTWMM